MCPQVFRYSLLPPSVKSTILPGLSCSCCLFVCLCFVLLCFHSCRVEVLRVDKVLSRLCFDFWSCAWHRDSHFTVTAVCHHSTPPHPQKHSHHLSNTLISWTWLPVMNSCKTTPWCSQQKPTTALICPPFSKWFSYRPQRFRLNSYCIGMMWSNAFNGPAQAGWGSCLLHYRS